jgi:hypothetical protein
VRVSVAPGEAPVNPVPVLRSNRTVSRRQVFRATWLLGFMSAPTVIQGYVVKIVADYPVKYMSSKSYRSPTCGTRPIGDHTLFEKYASNA